MLLLKRSRFSWQATARRRVLLLSQQHILLTLTPQYGHPSPVASVGECAALAASRGYAIFALQNGGLVRGAAAHRPARAWKCLTRAMPVLWMPYLQVRYVWHRCRRGLQDPTTVP